MSAPVHSSRPAVKRTYGSRQAGSSGISGSSSSKYSVDSSSSSSSPHKRARRDDAAISASSDGLDVSPTFTSTSQASSSSSPSSSDPSTPPAPHRNVNTGKSTALLPARRRLLQQESSITAMSKGKGRHVPRPKNQNKKLEQMHLAFSTAPLSVACSKCAMAYMRGSVDDEELHQKYCRKAASGIEWPASLASQSETSRVVQDGFMLGKGKEQLEASIWMVEGSSSGSLAKKLAEASETVDQSLSAAPLSAEQVKVSKYFLLLAKPADSLSKARKVIGCAIVERIQEAHRVVMKEAQSREDPGLLRFGEDGGAIFCSPIPTPALLGIHRIWTSPSHRRQGIAAHLLNALAEHAIYGRSIRQENRRDTIAFSQPSDAGRQLFAEWTGTREFLVFVD